MESILKLNKKDWKVLYELEKDARQPLQSIAKKTGTSKQLVKYMLNKYEQQKIILAYTAIIDSSRIGYHTYRVYIKFQSLNTKEEKEKPFDFLVNLNETTIVNKLEGYWDAGLTIAVKDIYDFYNVWEKMMTLRRNIADYKISIYSPISHFTRTLISQEKTKENPKVMVLGGKEKTDFLEIDIKILKELSRNVRQPVTEIAHKLNKSAVFISKRIKKMEQSGIIQGYRPLFNWSLLGYSYYKIDLFLNSHRRNKELFNFCHKHPNIIQVNQTIGNGSDFEFEVFVKSKNHFKKLMGEVQSKFSDIIINYEYFTVDKPYKETFMAF